MSRRVHVRYYAVLRERAGVADETVATDAVDAAALYDELSVRRDLAFPRAMLRVAVNDEFAEWSRPLADEDRIVFIPPVAGG